MATKDNKTSTVVIAAIALLILPLIAGQFGNAWVRIIDIALLYVLLALGLNIVVGYAGLLDLGYVAFYAVGAYMFGLLASPQLTETFPGIAAMFPNGLHTPWWVVIPLGAVLAGMAGVLLGAPTLKLRGDYLAIVTLAFGEIIRMVLTNWQSFSGGPNGIASIPRPTRGTRCSRPTSGSASPGASRGCSARSSSCAGSRRRPTSIAADPTATSATWIRLGRRSSRGT